MKQKVTEEDHQYQYVSNITENSGLFLSEVVYMSQDRQQWRETVSRFGAATIDLGDGDR